MTAKLCKISIHQPTVNSQWSPIRRTTKVPETKPDLTAPLTAWIGPGHPGLAVVVDEFAGAVLFGHAFDFLLPRAKKPQRAIQKKASFATFDQNFLHYMYV